MSDSNAHMMRAIASGDSEAFARFFDLYFELAYREACKCVRADEATYLDIVQEAMLRLIRSPPRIDDEVGLQRWFRRVVQSCAYDHLRARVRTRKPIESLRYGAPGRESAHLESSDATQAELAWLRQELSSLDSEEVELLTMRHRFGWTLRQISESVRSSTGAVDGRLRRIVNRLRRRAQEHVNVAHESE